MTMNRIQMMMAVAFRMLMVMASDACREHKRNGASEAIVKGFDRERQKQMYVPVHLLCGCMNTCTRAQRRYE